ncbi:hypothetical protein [Olavius algarvensis spirochete endosymbiont]|uniref:hypothetical protein n=1 Tax=Olavius algarvensis spirochete endosymbiont TaxID=260710 RepID=UPI000F51ABC1|nr:hypothetical protein [Olavius algarvensis spirochete endosymbiont]
MTEICNREVEEWRMKRNQQDLKMSDMNRRIYFLETEKNLSESEIKELQILKFARDVESNRVTNNEMSSKPKRLSLTDVRLKRVKA